LNPGGEGEVFEKKVVKGAGEYVDDLVITTEEVGDGYSFAERVWRPL